MRVLCVINSLGAGGAEQSLLDTIPHLHRLGVEVHVATLEDPASPASGRYAVGTRPAAAVRGLSRLVRDLGPDVLHTTLFEASLIGRLVGRRHGVPVLTSLVGMHYSPAHQRGTDVSSWKRAGVKAVDGVTGRHLTTHFHAVSAAVKTSYVESLGLPESRITVVSRGRDRARLGLPSEERRRRVRQRLGLAPDDVVLLGVGRQVPVKGFDDLVRGFESVPSSVPNAELLLVGGRGPSSTTLEQQIDASPARAKIRVLGRRDDIGDLLAAGDVFVSSSHSEGFSGATLEAMAMGVVPVVNDLPSFREIVTPGATGRLVRTDDALALGGALIELCRDPRLRAELGRNAMAEFDRRFTIEAAAGRMADLYREVAR